MNTIDETFQRELDQLLRHSDTGKKYQDIVDWINTLHPIAADENIIQARLLARYLEQFAPGPDHCSAQLAEAMCVNAYLGFNTADRFVTMVCILLDVCVQQNRIELAKVIGDTVIRSLKKFSGVFQVNEDSYDHYVDVIERRIRE